MTELLVPFPTEKYDVILADPAWRFLSDNRSKGSRTAASYYRTMTYEDIKALPVSSLAARPAALFLWVPNSLLPIGIETMEAWGFKYTTIAFTWVKTSKKTGKPIMGMGHNTRQYTEHCLLGKRGAIKRDAKDVPELMMSPRLEHSRKPVEQYARIQRLYQNRRYIELFARATAPDWSSWGLETTKFDPPIPVAA